MRFLLILSLLSTTAVAQVQLASPQALEVYRSLIPKVQDAGLNDVLHDPRTIWYTGTEMPRAYQFDSQGDGRMGAHSADYNIAPKRGDVLNGQPVSRDFDPHGNGNKEWPWDHPAVLNNDDNRVKNVVGLYVPDGRPVVIHGKVYLSRIAAGRTNRFARQGIGWTFPIGANLIELITTRVSSMDLTFKIFRMEKVPGGWKRTVYRPFPTQESYEQAIGQRISMPSQVFTLQNPHPRKVFNETVEVKYLPAADPQTVVRLLTKTSFKECRSESFIPTTRDNDQIVPRQYLGAFISNATDQKKCVNCHREVGLDTSEVETNRDWYGLFRGSDEVFSFHPFAPVAISQNETHTRPAFNGNLMNAGIIAKYDPAIHSRAVYGVIRQ